MKANKSNEFLVQRMSEYCEEIPETIERFGDSLETFSTDRDYQKSVGMSIFQIGELSTHSTKEFQEKYDEIPWEKIRKIRNLVGHEYEQMDIKKVWGVAKEDIPSLLDDFKSVLADLTHEQAIKEAQSIFAEGTEIIDAKPDKSYYGAIVAFTKDYAIQEADGQAVLHKLDDLDTRNIDKENHNDSEKVLIKPKEAKFREILTGRKAEKAFLDLKRETQQKQDLGR
ncbi:hypothetical protein FACS1894187_02560 [Synergistales bacterium]|nr:hypothetical protein FACS1894187_02560 [Synergistales bacterium]